MNVNAMPLRQDNYLDPYAKMLLELLDQETIGVASAALYENGNSAIFTQAITKNPYYDNYASECETISTRTREIAAPLLKTNTWIGVGMASAVNDKEIKIWDEIVAADPKSLRKIVLIDISSEFNKQSEAKIQQWIQSHSQDLSHIEIITINKSIFDLTAEEIAELQDGNVTVSCMGGTFSNPICQISSDTFPIGSMRTNISPLARLAANPEADSNKVILSYNSNKDSERVEKGYTFIPEDDYQASWKFWFVSTLAHIYNKIPGFVDLNRDVLKVRNGSVSADTLLDMHSLKYTFHRKASASQNGLRALVDMPLKIPRLDGGYIERTIDEGKVLRMVNMVHPKAGKMGDLVREIEHPMTSHSIYESSNPQSGSTIQTFNVPQKPVLVS